MEPILAPNALTDLEEIWEHIAQDSPESADRFIGELLAVADNLAQYPKLGRARPALRKGVRSLPHGNYLVFYEIVESRVRILRFAHGSRNLADLFRT